MGWTKSLRQQGLAALLAASTVGYTAANVADMEVSLDFEHPTVEGRIARGVFNDRLTGSYSFSTDSTQMYVPFKGCRKIFVASKCKNKQLDVVFSSAIDPALLQGPLEVNLDFRKIGDGLYESTSVHGANTLNVVLDENPEVDTITLTYTSPDRSYTAEGWIYEVHR